MKSTGIVRKIDDLGRVVLPMELRKSMNIGERDPLEIFTQDDLIILKKHGESCPYCGSREKGELIKFRQGHICGDCLSELREL